MTLFTNNSFIFGQQSFEETKSLNNFTAHAPNGIKYGLDSFKGSNISQIIIQSSGPVLFDQFSFIKCKNLFKFLVFTSSSVTFSSNSFEESQIKGLSIHQYDDLSFSTDQKDSSVVSFDKDSFDKCSELKFIEIDTKGSVNIKKESFENNNVLETLKIHAEGSVIIETNAFYGCDSLKTKDIDSPDKKIDDCAFGNCSGKKKKKLSIGAIIGIAFACVIALGAIIFYIIWSHSYSKKRDYKNI